MCSVFVEAGLRVRLDPQLTCVDVEADLQVGPGGPKGPPLRIPNTRELRSKADLKIALTVNAREPRLAAASMEA